jgi:hypothetical protein
MSAVGTFSNAQHQERLKSVLSSHPSKSPGGEVNPKDILIRFLCPRKAKREALFF